MVVDDVAFVLSKILFVVHRLDSSKVITKQTNNKQILLSRERERFSSGNQTEI